jgi:hypothetical protein
MFMTLSEEELHFLGVHSFGARRILVDAIRGIFFPFFLYMVAAAGAAVEEAEE